MCSHKNRLSFCKLVASEDDRVHREVADKVIKPLVGGGGALDWMLHLKQLAQ